MRPGGETGRDFVGESASILFVDDEPEVRRSFKSSLASSAFRIDLADSGSQARELVAANRYAVIVTDKRMPHTDGIALIHELAGLSPDSIFILVTGFGELALTEEAGALIHSVVFKPWDIEELVSTLNRAVLLQSQRDSRRHGIPLSERVHEILLVEDDPDDAEFVIDALSSDSDYQYHITTFFRLQPALDWLEDHGAEVAIVDRDLPDARGLDSVMRIRNAAPELAIVVLSGHEDEAGALHAVQAGAQDYLVKGTIDTTTLHRSIRYAFERKRSELQLARLAHYDQLTGLANRGLFHERVDTALARARRSGEHISVFFLDLDHFKDINDTFGHATGDAVLIEVARRLASAVRDEDTVARLAGDEFTVLAEKADAEVAKTLAIRIQTAFAPPIIVGTTEVIMSATIGVSVFPRDGKTLEELLKRADTAMYRGKRSGRNTFRMFDGELQSTAKERVRLLRQLHQAAEGVEFLLHYQPQLCVETGVVTGVEALLRWQHPTEGLLPPGEFLATLEDSGLIGEVGAWALRTACDDGKRWQAIYPRLQIAVNLSVRQVEKGGLKDLVCSTLAASGLPPETLELEITEGLIIRDLVRTTQEIAALKSLGVRVAMDDFGTGACSLTHLASLPLDTLKIDRSFVQDIHGPGRMIANSVVALGQSMGCSIVGEGVETEAQLALLRSLGCDLYQGYLGARPMSAFELTAWLRQKAEDDCQHERVVANRSRSAADRLRRVVQGRPLRVLLLEDDSNDADNVHRLLQAAMKVEIQQVGTLREARLAVQESSFDAALVDLHLPDAQGLAPVRELTALAPDTAILALTGLHNRRIGIEAIHAGAQEYLIKGLADAVSLPRAVSYAVERNRTQRQPGTLVANSPDGMVVVDPAGVVLFANPAAAAMMGRSAPQLVGNSLGLPIQEGDTTGVCREHGDPLEMRVVRINWSDQGAFLVILREENRTRLGMNPCRSG